MLLTTLLAALCLVAAAAITVAPTSAPVTVWASVDSLHRCGINDTPDIPARAFVDGSGLTHMIVGSTSFHWMTGPSVFDQRRNCTPAWNSTENPDPSQFASAEWLDSPHVFPNGTVMALVHVEYDAMNIEVPKCPHSYPLCWTVTITLARSDDWGFTWRHALPPPDHLVAAVPYAFNQTQPASGWGDPSNIIVSPLDGYYYFGAWNRNWVGLQGPGTCFLRTTDLTDPRSWRAHGGGGVYNVSLLSPYTMPPGEAGAHLCAVAENLPACPPGGIAWSTYLRQFVMTMVCDDAEGVWIAYSADLLTWTAAQEFYRYKDLPPETQRNVTSFAYPTFIDPAAAAAGDANFMSIGQDAPLFWSSIGHSPYTDGRRLWATNMHFEL